MMSRVLVGVCCGMSVVVGAGCLDRGGLDPMAPDGGGSGGKTDAGGTGATGGIGGSGSTGSGGQPTTGGVSGTGGISGTGGSFATGGRTMSTGGTFGSGGIIGSGGVRGTGGVKGTGGAMGTGGSRMCGPICTVFCPYGNVVDGSGCPTCQCNPGPICPAIGCANMCPFGYIKDQKGCDTCMCNPDPKACTPAECGPAPSLPYDIVCGTATAALSGPGMPAGASDVAGTGVGVAIIAPQPIVCDRNASGVCVWQSNGCRICAAPTCDLACPYGLQIGPGGCRTCSCNPPPPSACSGYTNYAACGTDPTCAWLEPGCAEPALAVAGCYPVNSIGCTSDASCGTGHQCLKRVINPCFNLRCASCASTQTICQ